jgi:hypothetical protein
MSQTPPEPAALPVVRTLSRRHVALGLIVVAALLLSALVVIRHGKMQNNTATSESLSPAPSSLMNSLAHLPLGIVNAVGVASPSGPTTPPTATGNPSLWQGSTHGVVALPVVFFYGAEFSPYAAAERWPLVVALSRFGTFGQLGLMQSSDTTAFSDLSTFTFWHSTYSSLWLDLQTVERYSSLDPTGAGYTALEKPTARQAASVAAYDTTSSTFPFLDIADHYVLVGSGFAPSVLTGLSQSQIAADLAYPTSPVTQAIVASANEITAAICSVTGQRPAAVCGARGVVAADARMSISPTG